MEFSLSKIRKSDFLVRAFFLNHLSNVSNSGCLQSQLYTETLIKWSLVFPVEFNFTVEFTFSLNRNVNYVDY